MSLCVSLPLSGAHLAGKAIDINLSQFIGNFRCSGQLVEGESEEQEEGEREEGRDRRKGLQQLPGVRLPTRLPHSKC